MNLDLLFVFYQDFSDITDSPGRDRPTQSGASMNKIAAVFLLFALMSTPSYAASCDEDSIQSVSDDGAIIIMLSGAVYQVDDPTEMIDTSLWLVADDVLVCDDKIINKDENGEHASIRRLR